MVIGTIIIVLRLSMHLIVIVTDYDRYRLIIAHHYDLYRLLIVSSYPVSFFSGLLFLGPDVGDVDAEFDEEVDEERWPIYVCTEQK